MFCLPSNSSGTSAASGDAAWVSRLFFFFFFTSTVDLECEGERENSVLRSRRKENKSTVCVKVCIDFFCKHYQNHFSAGLIVLAAM